MQTSADGLNGQCQVSRMTNSKVETWSPFGMSKVRSRLESLVARPCCSHQKGAVAKGSPMSLRHRQCRGVSTAKTATSNDLWANYGLKLVFTHVVNAKLSNGEITSSLTI